MSVLEPYWYLLVPITMRQLFLKSKCVVGNKAFSKSLFLKLVMVFVFLKMMHKNNIFTVRTCQQAIKELKDTGVKEVVFYGAGNMTKILLLLAKWHGIKVNGIYEIKNEDELNGYAGKIIINYFSDVNEKIKRLVSLGIQRNNMVRLT